MRGTLARLWLAGLLISAAGCVVDPIPTPGQSNALDRGAGAGNDSAEPTRGAGGVEDGGASSNDDASSVSDAAGVTPVVDGGGLNDDGG